MLDDVIGSYLDALGEREFDAPFMALLRALRFTDIHFLHGSFEFGKDFVAKRVDGGELCQYAFQTKAGDINGAAWSECRGQIDMLRTDSLAHPNFDKDLPRKAVFVTTGRLVGAAAVRAQEYCAHLETLGECEFETWDRERLVELMGENSAAALSPDTAGALIALLGQIDLKVIGEYEAEQYSRRWLSGPDALSLHRCALEAAVIANRLRRTGRLDLAAFVGLALLRASWERTHGILPPEPLGALTSECGRQLFRHYAWSLFDRCSDEACDSLSMVRSHDAVSAYITYPVRCCRLMETLALLALLEQTSDDPRVKSLADFLSSFVDSNPGVAHPISDRWGVSLIFVVLATSKTDAGRPVRLLKAVVKWVADRYDADGLGLAGPSAEPQDEVDRLLGDPFEHIKLDPRRESYIAAIAMDLAALLELGDVFDLMCNEFLAVKLYPAVIEVEDTHAQYQTRNGGQFFTANMEYSEHWEPVDGWKVSPHHRRAKSDYYLQRLEKWWDHLALSAVTRDRYFLETCRHFLT